MPGAGGGGDRSPRGGRKRLLRIFGEGGPGGGLCPPGEEGPAQRQGRGRLKRAIQEPACLRL